MPFARLLHGLRLVPPIQAPLAIPQTGASSFLQSQRTATRDAKLASRSATGGGTCSGPRTSRPLPPRRWTTHLSTDHIDSYLRWEQLTKVSSQQSRPPLDVANELSSLRGPPPSRISDEMSLSGQSSQSIVPLMTPSLSDSELSDAAEGQSPRGGPQSPSLRRRSQSLIHLSSTSPRILNPLRKLEKKFLQHEAERANERATVYETMPDSTNATHDPPCLAGQPRSEHINVMGAVGERHAPRPQAVVDVAGDLLAVASDVRVQIGSISTGISARELSSSPQSSPRRAWH